MSEKQSRVRKPEHKPGNPSMRKKREKTDRAVETALWRGGGRAAPPQCWDLGSHLLPLTCTVLSALDFSETSEIYLGEPDKAEEMTSYN